MTIVISAGDDSVFEISHPVPSLQNKIPTKTDITHEQKKKNKQNMDTHFHTPYNITVVRTMSHAKTVLHVRKPFNNN